jgi:hypothetical protein
MIREALDTTPKKPERAIALGDERLLSFAMSNAAARYGVKADVVPKRRRMHAEASTDAR